MSSVMPEAKYASSGRSEVRQLKHHDAGRIGHRRRRYRLGSLLAPAGPGEEHDGSDGHERPEPWAMWPTLIHDLPLSGSSDGRQRARVDHTVHASSNLGAGHRSTDRRNPASPAPTFCRGRLCRTRRLQSHELLFRSDSLAPAEHHQRPIVGERHAADEGAEVLLERLGDGRQGLGQACCGTSSSRRGRSYSLSSGSVASTIPSV